MTYVALGVWSAVCLFPIYWLGVTSIKSAAEADQPGGYLPFVDFTPSLSAWRFILMDHYDNLVSRFVNSLVIGVCATLLAMVAGGLVNYGLTRFPAFRWPHAKAGIMLFLLGSRILPPVVVVIPVFMMARFAGLLDTRLALVLVYGAVNLPVAAWLLLPVIGPRATDQEEAALLDGASRLSIVFTILLPMVRGGVAAAGLLVFLLCWNEYLFAAYLTSDNALTLPPWMVGQLSLKEAQVGGGAEELAQLSAAAVFMALPALVFAAATQRFLGRALAARR